MVQTKGPARKSAGGQLKAQRNMDEKNASNPGGIFDFNGQLGFYAAYHSNAINQYIHFVFVPALLTTAYVWFAYAGPLLQSPEWFPKQAFGFPIVLNVPLLLCTLMGLYYTSLDPFSGLTYLPVLWTFAIYATHVQTTVADAWLWALGVHVISWIVQFIGHGVFEGRKPALLDSLFQSLVLAPFFVWVEVLFKFGYRRDLQRSLQHETSKRIMQWKKQSR